MKKIILAFSLCAFCFGDWVEFGVGKKKAEPGYHKALSQKNIVIA